MAGDGGRQAYVTLITSDSFLPGVQVLAHSLRESGTQRPLVVVATSQVSAHVLGRIRSLVSEVVIVDPIPCPAKGVHVAGWENSGYTKLHVFGLTAWAKVVYIDADCLVLRNVDEVRRTAGRAGRAGLSLRCAQLFARPHPSFAPDVFPPDAFNAGVMVVEPSAALFESLLARTAELPTHDGGDTGFLNSAFPDWWEWPAAHRLPFRYNAQRTLHWFTAARTRGYWNRVGAAIVHYCSSPKPWEPGARRGELELAWFGHFATAQLPGSGGAVAASAVRGGGGAADEATGVE